jgi:beta-xylosidase
MVSCAVIFSLNPTFYYDETVRILVGGKQIPWNKLKSNIPNDLNSLFTWYPGSKDGSSYQILPGNKLRIKAATGTEYWRKISEIDNLPPTVSLAIDKDFEATVKITLDSKIDFQRAYFGVRDSKKKYRQTMVYIMEKSRIESSRVDENVKTTPNNDNSEFIMQPIGLKSSKDTIYFKIRKHQSNLDLFYSENGILWNPASDTIGSVQAAYEGYEIFFSVISNDYYEPAIADFSNLLIKYLDN